MTERNLPMQMGRRIALGAITAASITALVAAPAASAATRYAEPGGNGPAATCPQTNPCDVQVAAETNLVSGDTVILLPGTTGVYTLPTGDSLQPPVAITLRGPSARIRPRIVAKNATALAMTAAGSVLRDLRLETTGTQNTGIAFLSTGGLIERVEVIGRDATMETATISEARIRDSVFVNAGTVASGLAIRPLGMYSSFRNVTAIATNPDGTGFYISESGSTPPATVSIRNTIARGSDRGIRLQDDVGGAGTGDVNVSVSFSAYDVVPVSSGDVALTLGPGSITAVPLFANAAAFDFRQKPGSPTIDTGSADTQTGTIDVYGGPRPRGAAIDIGADEAIDTRSLLVLGGPKKIKRTRVLKIPVKCADAPCNVSAAATIIARTKNPKKTYKFSPSIAKAFLKRGQRGVLRFKLSKRELAFLKSVGTAKLKVVASFSAPLGFTGVERRTYRFR